MRLLDKRSILEFSDLDPEFDSEVFYSLIFEFSDECEKHNYSAHVITARQHILKWLYIFLDLNQLNYQPEIGVIWLKYVSGKMTADFSYPTAIYQFNDFIQTGSVDPAKIYVTVPTSFDLLDSEMKEPINIFLDLKRREGLGSSAITNYRSAIIRFCQFLISNNVHNFKHVTPELVIEFSLTDSHQSVEGRQNYMVRLKHFLLFLFEEHHIDNPCVYNAVRTMAAPKNKVVTILTAEQVERIRKYCQAASTPQELRNSAVVMIGLKTGLRGSDICHLKFSDIDWNKRQIHLIQKKTKVEIRLPFPTAAMNALFRYLKNGRPEVKSEFVFLSLRAPYNRLEESSCGRAIRDILPELPPKIGFHILRRSSASELFRRGAGKTIVAFALGHKGTDTVEIGRAHV